MTSRSDRVLAALTYILSTWSCAAVLAALLRRKWPQLEPFVQVSIVAFYAALFIAGFALLVVAPGVYIVRELYSRPSTDVPIIERRLRAIWYGGLGVILSAVLAAAYGLVIWGPIRDIKLWFVALCWVAAMVPWLLLGLVGRLVVRRVFPGRNTDETSRESNPRRDA